MPDRMFDPAVLERVASYRREEAPGTWPAKRELADALRGLLDSVCATDASEAELRRAAADIRDTARRFAAQPRVEDPEGVAEMALSGMEAFHDRSPIVGLSNPLAPPLELAPDPETGIVHGRVTFGAAYEGAPGCVHGGYVSAAFDELLGLACIFSGNPGMTGELTIRYVLPTPLATELRFEGRFDRVEGRKIFTSGECWAGDTLVSRSTGIFIQITREKFEKFSEQRKQRADEIGAVRTKERE